MIYRGNLWGKISELKKKSQGNFCGIIREIKELFFQDFVVILLSVFPKILPISDLVYLIISGNMEAFNINYISGGDEMDNSLLNTGTSGKRYKCPQCSYSSDQACNTRRHMATHTGLKPYRCHECQKSFIQKQHLKDHMFIHTGEKPFKCHQCNQTFRRKTQLQSHHVTYHNRSAFESLMKKC